jgi:hypothetical protein
MDSFGKVAKIYYSFGSSFPMDDKHQFEEEKPGF